MKCSGRRQWDLGFGGVTFILAFGQTALYFGFRVAVCATLWCLFTAYLVMSGLYPRLKDGIFRRDRGE